jgi:hypothetical protein
MKRAMHKWVEVDRLMVAYSTEGPVPDEVWENFVRDLKTRPITKYLGVSVGQFEVTSIQRKQVADALKGRVRGREIALAIVTDERLVRGIVTAASWLGVNVKSFSWAEIREALDHLEISPHDHDRVIKKIQDLKRACEEELRRMKA